MKTVKLEFDLDTAQAVLSGFEQRMSERIRARDSITGEITKLDAQVKSLRAQLQGVNGEPERAGQPANRTRIKDYLSKVPNGAGVRASAITKATGIGASSVAFTLKNYTDDFAADGKLWKLKQ